MNRILALLFLVAALFLSAASARAAYIFTNVADTTTAAPVGTFSSFGTAPSLSGGTAALSGVYNSLSASGIFTGSGGALTTIVKTGDAAPTGTFSSLGGIPSLSGSTAAFLGIYPSNQGIFTGSGGTLTTIAKTGDAAPVGTFSLFGGTPSISGSTAAFRGTYNGAANAGIFTGNGGALTTIAKTGDFVSGAGTLISFGTNAALSGSTAAFNGVCNSGSSSGIFAGSGGALTTIVKTGDAAPVGTFGNSFSAAPALSGSSAAFRASYTGGNSGIFTGSGGALTTIAKTGDSAPVGTFSSFGAQPSLSGSNVAFFGSYNSEANSGIFTGSGGALNTVILKGDSLFGSTVTNLDVSTFGEDAGSLAFSYSLADGRSGVAIATVPEPSSLALAAAGLLGLTAWRWRRKWQALELRGATFDGSRHGQV